MSNERQFLVLGSADHGRRVRAYEWNDVPESLNVSDFDVVILDFVSAFADGLEAELPLGYLPSSQDFAHLLFRTQSTVVAIGRPDASFKTAGDNRFGAGYVIPTYVQWWLPCRLPVDARSGERFEVKNEEWNFWFEHTRGYQWHFSGTRPYSNAQTRIPALEVVAGAADVAASWKPIAVSRADSPIAVTLEIDALSPQNSVVASNPRVAWLPALTELSPHESITLLLSNAYGVTSRGTAPTWTEAYSLPRDTAAMEEVATRELALGEAVNELEASRTRAVEAMRFRGLLYEHDDALEGLVYDALKELGATVTPPTMPGIEDGRLVDPTGREAMLEIKGNVGPLKVREVRQLDDWTRKALFDEGWRGKGVIVANLKLDLPPDERDELYGSQALSTAERAEIAILTTVQLYEALRLNELGELNLEAFWSEIFGASGPCDLPGVQPSR